MRPDGTSARGEEEMANIVRGISLHGPVRGMDDWFSFDRLAMVGRVAEILDKHDHNSRLRRRRLCGFKVMLNGAKTQKYGSKMLKLFGCL